MTDHPTNNAGRLAKVPPELAESLAKTLAQARSRGGDERTLRDLIANQMHMKKSDVWNVYRRFDSAWHAGVDASLHGGDTPAHEDDPFAHYAFLSGRGGAVHVIEEHARSQIAQSDKLSDADIAYYSALGLRHFLFRSLTLALVVGALVWSLSDASGLRLMAASAGAVMISASLGLQAATLLEYCMMFLLIAMIASGLAFAGYGEVLLPWLGASLVGAIDGMGQREPQRKARLARSLTLAAAE